MQKGIPQTELANWFDVEHKTIHHWLNWLNEGELETAVRNDSRIDQPRKLSFSQLNELEAAL